MGQARRSRPFPAAVDAGPARRHHHVLPGRPRAGGGQRRCRPARSGPRSDQMSFTATDMNGNRSARAVWPYKQWEHQAAQTVPAGTTASDWLRDVMVARVAVELRVDLLVTGSRPILDTALQWITEANPMTAERALAVVGLY